MRSRSTVWPTVISVLQSVEPLPARIGWFHVRVATPTPQPPTAAAARLFPGGARCGSSPLSGAIDAAGPPALFRRGSPGWHGEAWRTLVTSARAVPGPPASFLTGNAVALRRDLLGEFVRDRARYGDLVRYQIGPRPPLGRTFLVAHHPDDVRVVLSQTGRTLTKDTAMFRAAGDVLGRSLLTDDGPGYRRQRRIVQPLFTARQVAPLRAPDAAGGRPGRRGRLADDGIPPAEAAGSICICSRCATRCGSSARTLFGDDVERLVPVLDALMPEVGDAIRRRGLQVVAGRRCGGPRCATAGPDGCTASCRRWCEGVLAASARSGLGHGRDDLVGRLYDAADPAGAARHARTPAGGPRPGAGGPAAAALPG